MAFNRALLRFPQMIVSLVGLLRFVGVGTLGFLAIFLLHQLLLWASVNPADAFENAKSLYSILEILWDTTANVLNAFIDVVNVLVPAWNMVCNHVIEPAVYVALDVFFLIFFQRTYDGLISEDTIAYKGFYCDSNDAQSKLMCGDFGYYYNSLLIGEAGGTGVVDGSLVFSAETGRRMAEAISEPLVPTLPMAEVVNAFNWLVTVIIVVGAQLADVGLHVVYTVLSELAVLILDIIYTISNVIIEILLMLVRSGLLEKMMFLAIDLLTIYFVEIYIPIIFFQIDAFLCAINLMFGQNTWDSQLECAAAASSLRSPALTVAPAAGASRASASSRTRRCSPTWSSSPAPRSSGTGSTTSSTPRCTPRPGARSLATCSCPPMAAGSPRTSPRCRRTVVQLASSVR